MPRSENLLYVQIFEAKPNPLFTENQRATIRFLSYNKYVPCAECGKKSRGHWTALYEFLAHTMAPFVPLRSGLVHPPLAPVCRDHLLAPAWPEREREPDPADAPEQ